MATVAHYPAAAFHVVSEADDPYTAPPLHAQSICRPPQRGLNEFRNYVRYMEPTRRPGERPIRKRGR